jgi:hypothetical protein
MMSLTSFVHKDNKSSPVLFEWQVSVLEFVTWRLLVKMDGELSAQPLCWMTKPHLLLEIYLV